MTDSPPRSSQQWLTWKLVSPGHKTPWALIVHSTDFPQGWAILHAEEPLALGTVEPESTIPPSFPEYTTAMGEAGASYVRSKTLRGDDPLPCTFRWHELWDVLCKASRPTAPVPAYAEDLQQSVDFWKREAIAATTILREAKRQFPNDDGWIHHADLFLETDGAKKALAAEPSTSGAAVCTGDCVRKGYPQQDCPVHGAPTSGARVRLSDMADALVRELHRQGLVTMQSVLQGAVLRIRPDQDGLPAELITNR